MINKLFFTFLVSFALTFFVKLPVVLAISATENPNLFVLYEEDFESHSMCRAKLDAFVSDASQKFSIKALKVTDSENFAGNNENQYLYRIHPKIDETMSLSCKDKHLKVWYEFNN